MVDPLLILVGAVGVALIVYAFSRVNLLSRNARLVGISVLMMVLILLGNRILAPGRRPILPDNLFRRESPSPVPTPRETLPYDNLPAPSPDVNPSPVQPTPTPTPQLQSGWNDQVNQTVPRLVIAALAGIGNPGAVSPSSPSPSPSPSPVPAPSPSPSPTPSPVPSPAPASPSPDFSPPGNYTNPDFDRSPEQIPRPPTSPAPRPSRPVPAWW